MCVSASLSVAEAIRYTDWAAGNVMSAAAPPPSLKHWSVAVFSGGDSKQPCFTAVKLCHFPVREFIILRNSQTRKVEAFLMQWRYFILSLVCSCWKLMENSHMQSFCGVNHRNFFFVVGLQSHRYSCGYVSMLWKARDHSLGSLWVLLWNAAHVTADILIMWSGK